jgi:hypothetical protein
MLTGKAEKTSNATSTRFQQLLLLSEENHPKVNQKSIQRQFFVSLG